MNNWNITKRDNKFELTVAFKFSMTVIYSHVSNLLKLFQSVKKIVDFKLLFQVSVVVICSRYFIMFTSSILKEKTFFLFKWLSLKVLGQLFNPKFLYPIIECDEVINYLFHHMIKYYGREYGKSTNLLLLDCHLLSFTRVFIELLI